MTGLHRQKGSRSIVRPAASKTVDSRKVIVEFPDALYEQTQQAIRELSVTRSSLIRDAVSDYLRRLERRKLASQLAEGYRANAELNQKLSEEFVHVDGDNP